MDIVRFQQLHIWILTDYLDGLLVTKILDMFYNQCANYHAGWFVTCAVMRCQLNPTV